MCVCAHICTYVISIFFCLLFACYLSFISSPPFIFIFFSVKLQKYILRLLLFFMFIDKLFKANYLSILDIDYPPNRNKYRNLLDWKVFSFYYKLSRIRTWKMELKKKHILSSLRLSINIWKGFRSQQFLNC